MRKGRRKIHTTKTSATKNLSTASDSKRKREEKYMPSKDLRAQIDFIGAKKNINQEDLK